MNFSRQAQLGVGILVAVSCACLFLVLSFGSSNFNLFQERQIRLHAKFDEIAGLYVKAPVKIAGVKVGIVQAIGLESGTYRALVALDVDQSVAIPVDSIVKIYTEGVLGSKYLAIIPGYDDKMMVDGGVFAQAESSVILEGLIAQFVDAFSGS